MREAQGLPDRTRRGNQMPAVRMPESTAKTDTTPIGAKDFSGCHLKRELVDKKIPTTREVLDCTRNHQIPQPVCNRYLDTQHTVFKHQNQRLIWYLFLCLPNIDHPHPLSWREPCSF
jgi:hypothetical protein